MSQEPAKKLLNRGAVGRRYGDKHSRTIKRWVDRGVIPPPDLTIFNRDYWDEAKLDQHDRQRGVGKAPIYSNSYLK